MWRCALTAATRSALAPNPFVASTTAAVGMRSPVPSGRSTTAAATFTAPLLAGGVSPAERRTCTLTVSDGELSATSAEIVVTVEQVNQVPVPDAGGSLTVSEGSPVALDGSLSVDPDGDPLVSFQWTQTSGPPVTLAGADAATATFTAPLLAGAMADLWGFVPVFAVGAVAGLGAVGLLAWRVRDPRLAGFR